MMDIGVITFKSSYSYDCLDCLEELQMAYSSMKQLVKLKDMEIEDLQKLLK